MDIAMAAVKLAHQASGMDKGEDDEEMAPVEMPGHGQGRQGPGGPWVKRPREEGDGQGGEEGGRGGKFRKNAAPRGGPDGNMARLFIGVGRQAGIRPQDLVGAIAGEAGLAGKEVGEIQIAERFSVVSVPEGRADHVIRALQQSKIRGRRVTVRRDQMER